MAASTPVSATADGLPGGGSLGLVPADEPRDLSHRRLAVRRFLRHPAGMVGLILTVTLAVVGLLAGRLAPGDPFAYAGKPLGPPSGAHLFGTDNLGRDLIGAVIHGLRTSSIVVVWVVAIASVLGVAVGVVAGYRGGLADDVLMRFTELFQAIPRFFLVILILALFGTGTTNMILVLGVTSWPILARVVRADALSLRERSFVEAARSIGASNTRILLRHVLPNLVPGAVVVIALLASRVILLEASLSFLVGNAQRFIRVAWWMSVFPGAALAVAVLAVNLLADGLNDVFTPTR